MSLYKAVKPKRVSDQVFEQVRDLIFRGQLKPGEQIPPERELADTMGVSRPTVREAINKLVVRGLVQHHQGQGTFVRKPERDEDVNPLSAVIGDHEASLLELLEVRLGLECNAAVLAARRATDEDIALLDHSLEEMRERLESGGLAVEADTYFHMCIAYACGNQVQVHIMKSLYDLLHFGIKENLAHLYRDRANTKKVMDQHEKVFRAIRNHDTQAAFEAMRAHINFVIDFFAGQSVSSQ